MPELGSRLHRNLFVEASESEDVINSNGKLTEQIMLLWNIVQPVNYEYVAYINRNHEMIVIIIIMQEYISQMFESKFMYLDRKEKGNELKEIPDIDMDNIENIDDFYSQDLYSFEINTDKFKFRIMQVINSVAFPVRVILDEGIARDLNMSKPAKEINSNEQMENFLVKVLATNKVNNVVNQMLVLLETESEEKIKDYLITQPMGDTLAGIAKRINWSQRLTLTRLHELEEKGCVEEVKLDGKHKFWVWKKGVYS